MHEWTLLAEKIGINLFDVVDSIRVRNGTHDNMRYPGFGVGGYCLTKDSLLAQWSAANLFGVDTGSDDARRAQDELRHASAHTRACRGRLPAELWPGRRSRSAVSRISPRSRTHATRPPRRSSTGCSRRGPEPGPRSSCGDVDRAAGNDVLASLGRGARGSGRRRPRRPARRDTSTSPLRISPPCSIGGAFVVDAQNVLTDAKARLLHDAGRRVIGVGKGHWRARRYDS